MLSTDLVYDVCVGWESVEDLPQGSDVEEPGERWHNHFFFFRLWHLKGHVTRRRKSNRRRRSRQADRKPSQVQSLTGNSQVLCGDLCLWSLLFLLWEYVNIFFTSSDSHNILKARWESWSLPAASSSILIQVTVFGVKAAKKDKVFPKHDSEKMQSFGSYS